MIASHRIAKQRSPSHQIVSYRNIASTVLYVPSSTFCRPVPIPTPLPLDVASSPGVSRLLIHSLAPAIPSLWPGFVPFPFLSSHIVRRRLKVYFATHPPHLIFTPPVRLELTLLLPTFIYGLHPLTSLFPPVLVCRPFLLAFSVSSSRASIVDPDPVRRLYMSFLVD